jgi:hypothetical protein
MKSVTEKSASRRPQQGQPDVLVEGDRLVAEPQLGRFVRRARSGEQLAPGRAAPTA